MPSVKEGLLKSREGLPKEAFAIAGDLEDPESWKLPHHRKGIRQLELTASPRLARGSGRQPAL